MTVSDDAVEQGVPAAELTFTSGVWWRQRRITAHEPWLIAVELRPAARVANQI